MTDIWQPIDGSWSHHDHVRHFMYEAIYEALVGITWDVSRLYSLFEFGAREPTTSVIRMFKHLMGERIDCYVGEYPIYDIQACPGIGSDSMDVVVADQVLEHVERPWQAAVELGRILKTGGLLVVTTPFLHRIHPAPVDCWRIGYDGYQVLFPHNQWDYISHGGWGGRQMIEFEYLHNDALEGDYMSVAEARRLLGDGLSGVNGRTDHPIVIWLVARKT